MCALALHCRSDYIYRKLCKLRTKRRAAVVKRSGTMRGVNIKSITGEESRFLMTSRWVPQMGKSIASAYHFRGMQVSSCSFVHAPHYTTPLVNGSISILRPVGFSFSFYQRNTLCCRIEECKSQHASNYFARLLCLQNKISLLRKQREKKNYCDCEINFPSR